MTRPDFPESEAQKSGAASLDAISEAVSATIVIIARKHFILGRFTRFCTLTINWLARHTLGMVTWPGNPDSGGSKTQTRLSSS
jgi:hypothetical protein